MEIRYVLVAHFCVERLKLRLPYRQNYIFTHLTDVVLFKFQTHNHFPKTVFSITASLNFRFPSG